MDKSNIIEAIAGALTKNPFDLAEMDSIEAFLGNADRAGFLKADKAPSGLLMADHFDLEADLFIYDDKLGSLGLLQVLDWPKPGTKMTEKALGTFRESQPQCEVVTEAAEEKSP